MMICGDAMAEINKKTLTLFEQEMIDTAKKILEIKLGIEANVVSIIYKKPELLYDTDLQIEDFHNNTWKVFFEIAHSVVIGEKKPVLDEMTIGFYLDKHSKLRAKYDEYGGYATIEKAVKYVEVENYDGYLSDLKKWKTILMLCKKGFPVKDKLSDYADMTLEEIYNYHEAYLNNIFINASETIRSYNVFDGMQDFVNELNTQKEFGLPLHNADILTQEIGGFNINGNIYGLGAGSGVGKSTMAFNYLVPSAIKNQERIVFIINEEDERKFKKELIVWVANNIFAHKESEYLHKYTLRNGNFDETTLNLLKQCVDWIEAKKQECIFTVIPLERYSVKTVIKIIKKYSSAFNVRMFVLDTLKESFDAKTDEIFKSMMRDMIALYDVVKPSAKNVGLFVTYQLGKSSLKVRHLTNNEIGQAKSIIDVMSVNLMMRRPYDDEYKDGKHSIKCWQFLGSNLSSKKSFELDKEKNKNYMITFITKNRFGDTDRFQILSECDLSTNIYKDIGYCNVPQDW